MEGIQVKAAVREQYGKVAKGEMSCGCFAMHGQCRSAGDNIQ